jgi:hypothetical protein
LSLQSAGEFRKLEMGGGKVTVDCHFQPAPETRGTSPLARQKVTPNRCFRRLRVKELFSFVYFTNIHNCPRFRSGHFADGTGLI